MAVRVIHLLLFLSAVAPRTAASEPCNLCVCSGPSFSQRVQNAEAVFIGSLLDTGRPAEGEQEWGTFVVERAWKGVARDTVRLRGLHQLCGPHYLPGGTYLVIADSAGGVLVAPNCDDAIPIQRDDMRLHMLGPPRWIAPPSGQRVLDKLVQQTLSLQSNGIVQRSVPFQVFDTRFGPLPGVRVELLGTKLSSVTNSGGYASLGALAVGWHLIRLTGPDGTYEDRYVRLFCDQRAALEPKSCRLRGRHIIPRSAWGDREYDAHHQLVQRPTVPGTGTTTRGRTCVLCDSGKGHALIDDPSRGAYSVSLDFQKNARGDWIARTRLGGVRRMVGKVDVSQHLPGRLPPNGAVVNISVAAAKKDSSTISGQFSSPVFGDLAFLGKISGQTLQADLYVASSGFPAGKFTLSPLDGASRANYEGIGAKIRDRVEMRGHRHKTLRAHQFAEALDEFQNRTRSAVDDLELLLAFYVLSRRLEPMNLGLHRNSMRASCLDSPRPECPLIQAPGDTRSFDRSHVGDGWVLTIEN